MKKYVVVGGSSGIGFEITKKMVEHGNEVYVYSREKRNLDNIPYVFHQKVDVSEENFQLQQIPEKINGLVYCPGTIQLKPFKRIQPENFIRDYKINVLGAIGFIQQLYGYFTEKSSIVLFSTVAVQYGMPFHSLVAASKGAIEGLTRSLAAEFAPKIRVNAIAPSLTDTRLAEKMLNTEEKRLNSANRHPLKRIGNSEDIANAALFLLGTQSEWITGQIIHVDGGLSSIR